MKMIDCPKCGKGLIRLEPFETGVYDYWCDNCDMDIHIELNNDEEKETE